LTLYSMWSVAALSLLLVEAADASSFKLPTFVASHMALQRAPLPARLWGTAAPGAHVTATLDKKVSASGLADADGNWRVDLPPQPAGVGHTIVLTDGTTTKVLDDVAFGDVFLCSGQSNMEFSVNMAFNATAEISDSVHYPDIRLATPQKVVASTPQTDVASKSNYSWARAGPAAFSPVSGHAFSWFSATCYFFGRELSKAMGGQIPIGLVASDWGGQRVECFSSPDALADQTCGGILPTPPPNSTLRAPRLGTSPPLTTAEDLSEHYYRLADEPNPGPSQLWNAMIYPLLPMRFTAAIWYQGEANAGNPAGYACRFPAMIADWRRKFGLPSLGFFYVQLAAFHSDYSLIRAAQGAALQLPGVGMAVAIDLGDPTSPYGSIHPRRKQEVGRRLALAARAIQYGHGTLVYRGPVLSAVQLGDYDGDTAADQPPVRNATAFSATLGFEAGSSDGLHLSGSAACTNCCQTSPFEVIGWDRQWTRVPATVVGSLVRLTSPSPIVGIRLSWEGYPQCALYNGVGGPDNHTALAAAPFQWCSYGTVGGAGDWEASCSTHDPSDVYYPASVLPTSRLADFTYGGAGGIAGKGFRDASCSGYNLRSGNPGQVGTFTSHAALHPDGHTIDSFSMRFRYVAGFGCEQPFPCAGASTLSLELTDANGLVLKTIYTSPPLGNASYAPFTSYSPVVVEERGIGLTTTQKVHLTIRVTNNERNLQLALDDLASGFSATFGWK